MEVTESATHEAAATPTAWAQDDIVACDIFAGAGGFSLGAHLAKVKIAAAVELNRHACNTYKNNLIKTKLTGAKLYSADVTTLDLDELRRESGLDVHGCDILLGGPPCQGFSRHRINNAGVNDPRNQLLLKYFEFVRRLRPTFFLVENVPGLLWSRHAAFLDAFKELAEAANYGLMEPQVLNARDYGVPQNRRRVFLLGYDRSSTTAPTSWPPSATHADPREAGTKGLQPWLTAGQVFEHRGLAGDINDVHMNHGPTLLKAFAATPPNGGSRADSGRVLPCHENHRGHFDVYGRIDPLLPAPTMTTACINPSKGRFVHPTEHHGITLRQAAQIQSFPDWFVFEGGIIAGGVQVGNAVPVRMAQALIEPLKAEATKVRQTRRAKAA
jgi:DNA (cytosine-5)-methyltransferase 1